MMSNINIMADKSKQAWIGNIPAEMDDEDGLLAYVASVLPLDHPAPFKAVVRPSQGDSIGMNFAFLSWKHEEHAAWFRENAVISWPNGKYALIKTDLRCCLTSFCCLNSVVTCVVSNSFVSFF